MKNLWLLSLVLLLITCQPTVGLSQLVTTFSGKITQPNSNKIYLSGEDFKQQIVVDKEGSFSVDLKGINEGAYSFHDTKEGSDLYLVPGNAIHMTVDTEAFDESISYAGPGAAPNNYLAKKFLKEETAYKNRVDFYAQDEAAFSAAIVKAEKDGLQELNSLKDAPSNFIKTEKRNLELEKLIYIHRFGSSYRQDLTGDTDFQPSAEFSKPLEKVNLDLEDDFKNNMKYSQLVQIMLNKGTVKESLARLSHIKSDHIKEFVVSGLKKKLHAESTTLDEDYKTLMAYSTDEKYTKEVEERYQRSKALAKGSPSPAFEFENRYGKMVKLEDLRGKNVYVDVWATWCGPCKEEIPDLKKLEAEYHDKKIAFVSLSVDKMKDKEKWLSMIKEKELGGVQLLSDSDWKTDFIQDYGIKSIPRFILLDHEGKIVSADAPRPSSGKEIKGMIDNLKI